MVVIRDHADNVRKVFAEAVRDVAKSCLFLRPHWLPIPRVQGLVTRSDEALVDLFQKLRCRRGVGSNNKVWLRYVEHWVEIEAQRFATNVDLPCRPSRSWGVGRRSLEMVVEAPGRTSSLGLLNQVGEDRRNSPNEVDVRRVASCK